MLQTAVGIKSSFFFSIYILNVYQFPSVLKFWWWRTCWGFRLIKESNLTEDLGPLPNCSSMAKGICIFVGNQIKGGLSNLLHCMNVYLNKISTKVKKKWDSKLCFFRNCDSSRPNIIMLSLNVCSYVHTDMGKIMYMHE